MGIDIEDLKGFSDLANEQISNMIDIRKAFDVYRFTTLSCELQPWKFILNFDYNFAF